VKHFETQTEAFAFMDQKLKRRLTAPKRIGCPYQILSVDERDDMLAFVNSKTIKRFSWVKERKDLKG